MVETFLKLPEVVRRCGLSRSRIYALVQAGKFPRPIKLSERASAWVESEIAAWQNSRIEGVKP